jgi:hypothetical protein
MANRVLFQNVFDSYMPTSASVDPLIEGAIKNRGRNPKKEKLRKEEKRALI